MDLGEGLRQAIAKLTRTTIIDARTIREFTKELQKSLLSADVEVGLVLSFSKEIEKQALESKPPQGVTSKEFITKLVYDGLVRLMGESYVPAMKRQRILLMGLYGSGKTTTAAKLAKFYQDRGLSAAVICCDVSRPAAYTQLDTLARQANVGFFGASGSSDPAAIVKQGMERLRDKQVVICDTSGRSALDSKLIEELKAVSAAFAPDERVLVVSADIGQVAGRQATEFDKAVKVSGIIVTKMDGSGKGGGALSAAHAAKAKAMFIGTGEKLGNIEAFDSGRFIGGLLGMPDIAALVANVQKAIADANIKPEAAEELNFETFYDQLRAMSNMGPLKNVLGMMGASDVPKGVMEESEERLGRYKVIIASMTSAERKDERLLRQPGRIRRIALGSGVDEREVHRMVSDFNKMKRMYGQLKNDRGLRKRLAGLGA